ncbi:hypothetical protein ABK040_009539 [Willaertia magna]
MSISEIICNTEHFELSQHFPLWRASVGNEFKAKPFKHYSGYIQVDEPNGRHLWYYFQQCQEDPFNKPLILFLNGGPGCSGMEYWGSNIGNVQIFKDTTTTITTDREEIYLKDNPYSFNRFSNIIYLDSPSGVGFSYSNSVNDYQNIGDERTARDTRKFLIEFFKHYKEYKNLPLYIIGVSYGGKYAPNLSKLILEENDRIFSLSDENYLNLKATIVGNPLVDWSSTAKSNFEFFQSLGIISKRQFKELNDICKVTEPNWALTGLANQQCVSALVNTIQKTVGDINIYNLYEDICLPDKKYDSSSQNCYGHYIHKYMNDVKVQEYLKVRNKVDWDACNPKNGFSFGFDNYISGLPTYQYLINRIKEGNMKGVSNHKLLIYTGDMDGSTSVKTYLDIFENLPNTTVVSDIDNWFVNGQVAGKKRIFDTYTYTTIRGAGHITSQAKPQRLFALISNFINNGTILERVDIEEYSKAVVEPLNVSVIVLAVVVGILAVIVIVLVGILLCAFSKNKKKIQMEQSTDLFIKMN